MTEPAQNSLNDNGLDSSAVDSLRAQNDIQKRLANDPQYVHARSPQPAPSKESGEANELLKYAASEMWIKKPDGTYFSIQAIPVELVSEMLKTPDSEGVSLASEEQIKHMVTRFLGWKIPEDFMPDGGISYKKPNDTFYPIGTNLLTSTQAEAMVRYMLDAPGLDTDDPSRANTAPVSELAKSAYPDRMGDEDRARLNSYPPLYEQIEELFNTKISSQGNWVGIRLGKRKNRVWIEFESFIKLRESIAALIDKKLVEELQGLHEILNNTAWNAKADMLGEQVTREAAYKITNRVIDRLAELKGGSDE